MSLRRPRGFTLLEVMLAVSVAAIAIVALLELYSGSLHLAGASTRQTEALIIARSLMDQQLWRVDLEDVTLSGTEGDFHWQVEVYPMPQQLVLEDDRDKDSDELNSDYELKEISVLVSWGEADTTRDVRLRSARLTELF